MKALTSITSLALVAAISVVMSCQKQDSKEPVVSSNAILKSVTGKVQDLKGTMTTWTGFDPDESANNNSSINLPVFAWYPGQGEGNIGGMGNFRVFFNQYAYPVMNGNTPDPIYALGNAYTLTTEQIEEVNSLLASGTIPVNTVTALVDHQGNAIFVDRGIYVYQMRPDIQNRSTVSGTLNISGGIGKYEGVHGYLTVNGYADRSEPLSITSLSSDQFQMQLYLHY